MFRNRHFLYGLGLGLVLGSVLLQLMLSADTQKDKLDAIDSLGGPEQTYTQDEVDRMIDDAVKKAVSEAAEQQLRADEADNGAAEPSAENGEAEAPAGAAAEGEGNVPETSGGEKEEPAKPGDAANQTSAAAEEVSVKIVRIEKGATSETVAAKLKAEGVIQDERAFLRIMSDSATRIQVGRFLFVNDPSPEKVKEIITGTPFAS